MYCVKYYSRSLYCSTQFYVSSFTPYLCVTYLLKNKLCLNYVGFYILIKYTLKKSSSKFFCNFFFIKKKILSLLELDAPILVCVLEISLQSVLFFISVHVFCVTVLFLYCLAPSCLIMTFFCSWNGNRLLFFFVEKS